MIKHTPRRWSDEPHLCLYCGLRVRMRRNGTLTHRRWWINELHTAIRAANSVWHSSLLSGQRNTEQMSKTSFWLFCAWLAVITYTTSSLVRGHTAWFVPLTIALSIIIMDYSIQKERHYNAMVQGDDRA